ncbi:MAG: alcohol dehydrogenase [Chloroflexota bacterium]|nr:MAG: alcohol dehydrogenase [Chloroflexota bacterium]
MRAVSFLGNRQAVVIEKPDPIPGPGQIIVRMVRAAICGSDLHGYRRDGERAPDPKRTPGHEPVGVIAQVGPGVENLAVGQRVLVYHRVGCGNCRPCRTGNTNICMFPRYGDWEGSDADYARCYARYCYPIPDDLSWDDAVVISCQGGTAYAPLRRVGASGRDAIVVSGLGPVGLNVVALGRAMGATMIGLDPMAERRALATSLGAAATFDPRENPAEDVRKLTDGGANALIETSGSAAAHAKVQEYVTTEAMVAIVGLGHTEPSMNPISLFGKQITLFASNLYPEWMLPEIIGFVQKKRVPLSQIISHRVPLSDASRAFQMADSATTGKIVFAWDG